MFFRMSTATPVGDVRALTDFAKKWLHTAPEIDNYTDMKYLKCHVTDVDAGFQLNCIFDMRKAKPGEKFSRKDVRQRFIFEVMGEAQRLGISTIPQLTANEPVVRHQAAVAKIAPINADSLV